MKKITIFIINILLCMPQVFSAAGDLSGAGSAAASSFSRMSRAARLKRDAQLSAAATSVYSRLSRRRCRSAASGEQRVTIPPTLPPKEVLDELARRDTRPPREKILDRTMPTYSSDEFRAEDGVPNHEIDTQIREGAIRNDVRFFNRYEERLVDFDARARYEEGRYSTPLMFAAWNNSIDALRWLLAHPTVNPFNVDINRRTAFTIACEKGHFELVKILYEDMSARRAADRFLPDFLNMADIDGMTPLMYACDNHDGELAEFLIHRGASTIQEDKDGHDAYWYAGGSKRISDMIIEYEEAHDIRPPSSDQDTHEKEDSDDAEAAPACSGGVTATAEELATMTLDDID